MKNRNITTKMISLMSKQSIKSSRMRNFFVMATIVLASALLTAILMFAIGQNQRTKNELSHRYQAAYYNLTKQQAEILKADERIAFLVQAKTGILSEMDGFDIMPYYVSELSEEIRIAELISGDMPKEENEIAIQTTVLEKMNIDAAVGSSVTFTFYDGNTETFRVSGILKGNDTAKQFSVFFSESYAENGSQLTNMPYEIYTKLHNATNMSENMCKEEMYTIGKDAGIERKNIYPSKAFLDSLSVDTQSVMVYGLVGMVILLACVLVIYGVFYLSVIGRVHQFGQLRTIGMTQKQMKKLVSCEGGILFFRSAPIGIAIGGIVGFFLVPDGFRIDHTLFVIAFVFAVIYIITILSVRKPARIAASVSPMEALRYLPQEKMKQAGNKKMCRRLTPLGLGVMNFSKNRKKAAITMMSLGMGGILFMAAATYMSSFDKANFARQGYFVDAEFNIYYPLSAIELNEYGLSGLQAENIINSKMIQELSAIDGVKKVREIRKLGVQYDYVKNDLYGDNDNINPLTNEEFKDIDKYLEEGSVDTQKLMSGDYVLVAGNNVVEEIFGWRFVVGDSITIHFYDGNKMTEKNVTILGILNNQYTIDYSGVEGWFLMPEQAVLDMVMYKNLDTNLIVSTEADKEEAVGEKIAEMVADKPQLSVETLADRRIVYEQNANQLFGAISSLAIFIMMFSILSMMNTLITNIVTRKQELAMLESIGMGKGQMRKMLLGESLLLIVVTICITMTIGTLCGLALSNLLYDIGAVYMAFRFPIVFALAYVGVLTAVPLLITVASMHSFSKEALVERLRGVEN